MDNSILKGVQETELEMLVDITKILDDNNLQYFLIGGTLLGAKRHAGFIPWDDDIDIGMPRKDYEKFREIASQKLPEKYFYQDHVVEKKYPYYFAKIRKNGTLFLDIPSQNMDIHHGVYIDIFPLDGVCSDAKKQKKHIKKIRRLMYMKMSSVLIHSQKNKKLTRFMAVFILLVLKKLYGAKRIDRKIDKMMKKYSYDDSSYVANLLGMKGIKEVVPIDFFESSKEIDFEGYKFKCPNKSEEYLTQIYGDYMKLPPEEQRTSMHQIKEIKL